MCLCELREYVKEKEFQVTDSRFKTKRGAVLGLSSAGVPKVAKEVLAI